jgi:hypothetical protein
VHALTTLADTALRCDVGVLWGELVASLAVSSGSVDNRRPTSSRGVLVRGDGLQVRRVDARTVWAQAASFTFGIVGVAEVVKVHAVRDGADQQLISHAVCADGMAATVVTHDDELTVAAWGFAGQPRPAFVRAATINLHPEALFDGVAKVWASLRVLNGAVGDGTNSGSVHGSLLSGRIR